MKASTAAVARLLIAKGSDGLTEAEAHAQLHISRLAARIWELRQQGWVIEAEPEWTGDHESRFARYHVVAIPPDAAVAFRPLESVA